ncbi:hypothetical protein INO76_15930, partial [Staphylococcus aureus]|nr:hypothetical protein [Staphylococcus aureus]
KQCRFLIQNDADDDGGGGGSVVLNRTVIIKVINMICNVHVFGFCTPPALV